MREEGIIANIFFHVNTIYCTFSTCLHPFFNSKRLSTRKGVYKVCLVSLVEHFYYDYCLGFLKVKGTFHWSTYYFFMGAFGRQLFLCTHLGIGANGSCQLWASSAAKKSKYKMATPHKVRNIVTKELDHETSFFIPFKKAKYVFYCFKTKNK